MKLYWYVSQLGFKSQEEDDIVAILYRPNLIWTPKKTIDGDSSPHRTLFVVFATLATSSCGPLVLILPVNSFLVCQKFRNRNFYAIGEHLTIKRIVKCTWWNWVIFPNKIDMKTFIFSTDTFLLRQYIV